MADDKQNINDGPSEPEEKAPVAKRSPLPIIIGIVVAVLLLGAGGFSLYTFMNPAEAAEEDEEATEEVEITETNIYYSGFQTNVVNLAGSTEYEFMYLKYGFDLELSDSAISSELTLKLPRITANVAGVMSNQDWLEICTPQGRERLAREALRIINDELTDGEVIGLYFTTFVAQ